MTIAMNSGIVLVAANGFNESKNMNWNLRHYKVCYKCLSVQNQIRNIEKSDKN